MCSTQDLVVSPLDELGVITSHNYIEELRAAATNVTPWEAVPKEHCPAMDEVKIAQGTLLMFALYRQPDICIARAFMSANSLIEQHTHGEREIIGIISGHATVRLNGNEELRELRQYDVIIFEPNTPHAFVVHEDTWMIAVTLPASEGYPHDARH
jgi:quercetin dioxygenase-like cupin family protein